MSALPRLVTLALSLAILVSPRADAASPETKVMSGGTTLCKLWTGSEPDDVAVARFAGITSLVEGPGGSKRFEFRCGQSDFFTFGPGFDQAFAGVSWTYGFGYASFGVLRLYAEAGARAEPTLYGPPFVIGTNPYAGRARVSTAVVGFADLFTPPPTAGAPNPGDPTTIKVQGHLSCIESGITLTRAGCNIYTPADYDAGQPGYAGFEIATRNGGYVSPCPIDASPVSLPATVGQTVVLYCGLGIDLNSGVASTAGSPAIAFVDALNTSTFVVTDAAGGPLTGVSGHVYVDPGVLPPFTTTTSTTTTTTTLAPPILPSCGDGMVDDGESCDCPPTADPVLQGYGCRGADVIPPQESCVVCRRCALATHLCEETGSVTTTTTLPGSGTPTTTTVPGSATTTTTLPGGGACAGRDSLALASCVLESALDEGLCPGTALPAKPEKKLRRQLGSALKAITKANGKSGKAARRLVKRARGKLGAAQKASDRAAASAKPQKRIPDGCRATITELVGVVQDALR